MLKTYKYRLYPDDNQKDFLSRQFGCCRFVYNWGLELKTKSWQAYKKGISIYKIANKLPELKKENPWLAEVCSQPLQQSLFHLEKGFTSFFRKKTKYPRFKSKWDKQAAAFPQHVSVEFSSGTMLFPKLGRIRAVFSRTFSGTVKTVTVTKTPTGKYFASVLVEESMFTRRLTEKEKEKIVQRAIIARWKDPDKSRAAMAFNTKNVLEGTGDTLFEIFLKLQDELLKGGYRTISVGGTRKEYCIRGIRSGVREYKFRQEIFKIAVDFLELKEATA